MIERDYIMRLIREFFETLEKLKETREKEQDLNQKTDSMYRTFFLKPKSFFHEQDTSFLMHYLSTTFPASEILERIEMLTELMLFDANSCASTSEKQNLLTKVLDLLCYLDTHSRTFSMERRSKISEIKKIIYQ